MSVRLPRLLDANLNELGRLRPSRLQADIKMTPLSRATMSLPGGETDVPMRAFVEIYNSQGSLGVYRVSSSVPDYGKGQTIGLKHGLTVLDDATTGDEETLSGSARQVIGNLLACQTQKVGNTPFWTLGRVEVPDSVSVSVPGERVKVLQTLLDILKLPGINGRYMYTFDQSAFPWVLNVTALTDADASEARLGRNLTAVSPTYDDSELVTRVYADGLTNGYMDAVSPFGVIAAKLDIPEGVDANEYAREYLDTHKEPRSQIRLDAQELFQLTGDSLDRFYPGHMCRVPLPAYGAMLHFRVVTVTYEDLMSDPESVTVEMSNARDDTSYRLASQSNKINSNAGSISRNSSRISRQGVDLRKTQEDLVELDGSVARRFNDVGVTLNEQDAKLDLFASQTIETVDGLRKRISSAEITLDGANARIIEEAKRIDTLTGEISTAKLDLDGANQRITALTGIVDEQGNLLSGVQLDLKGKDQQLTALAGRLDDQGKLIEGVQVDMKGKDQQLTALAGRLDDQGKLIEGVQVDLKGKDQQLTALAGTVDKHTKDLEGVRVDLKGKDQQINLMAGTISEQGDLIDGVSLRMDGIENEIELKADKIILDGYVTASQFQSEIARVNAFFSGVSVISNINASRATINALQVGAYALGWQRMTVVNSFTQASGETQNGTSYVLGVAAPAASVVTYTPNAGETITF